MGFLSDKRPRQKADAERLLASLVSKPDTPASVLVGAVRNNEAMRPLVAANPGAPLQLLEALALLEDPEVDEALATNPTWLSRGNGANQ